jgi:hypothetical protein
VNLHEFLSVEIQCQVYIYKVRKCLSICELITNKKSDAMLKFSLKTHNNSKQKKTSVFKNLKLISREFITSADDNSIFLVHASIGCCGAYFK